jgi:hypothetical protein
VKYADDLVLLAKEQTVLQGMTDRITELGRCYGMEMNVEKNYGNEIARQPSPIKNYDIKNNWRMWDISIIWVA